MPRATLLAIQSLIVASLVAACSTSQTDDRGAASGPSAGLRIVRDIPLPGDTSRFDYLSYDAGAHRLYIAHLGAGEVVVFDTQAAAVVGTVRVIPGVHGVLAVPEWIGEHTGSIPRMSTASVAALIDPAARASNPAAA